MRNLFRFVFLILLIIATGYGQTSFVHHSKADIYCGECHSCDKPTEENPCLICCPEYTRKGVTVRHSAEKAPEFLTLDILANIYQPSFFTHRLHAEMADMSGGCISCHHYNPPGIVAACRECHPVERQRENLRKPDLQAAYHRQCLNCHRTWDNTVKCTLCHETNGNAPVTPDSLLKKEFSGKKHPRLEMPEKKVYQTEFDEGAVVTFYHTDHVKMYQLSCADCHQDEACSSCHRTMQAKKIMEREPHGRCVACHSADIDENCSKCHDSKERARFDHAKSGFNLEPYHSRLKCQACHGKNGKFTKVNSDCRSCHKKWEPANFDHSVTGLILDENHVEQDCQVCHSDLKFTNKPQCTECHDDFSYPAQKPGRKADGKK